MIALLFRLGYGSRKVYYYFMAALVFCWYSLHCLIPSLSFKISETIKKMFHQVIQDFGIQTNAKSPVYSTQENFCKRGLPIVPYPTLIAFNNTPSAALVTFKSFHL